MGTLGSDILREEGIRIGGWSRMWEWVKGWGRVRIRKKGRGGVKGRGWGVGEREVKAERCTVEKHKQ